MQMNGNMQRALACTLLALTVFSASAGAGSTRASEVPGPLTLAATWASDDAEWVHWSDLGALRRVTGIDPRTLDDVPLIPLDGDAERTREQEAGRLWWGDVGRQIPVSDFLGTQWLADNQWKGWFGYDLFDVEQELHVGEPPARYSVIQTRSGTRGVARALEASGYTSLGTGQEPVLSQGLYASSEEYALDLSSPMRRAALNRMNRVALGRDVLVAAPGAQLIIHAAAAQNAGPAGMSADRRLLLSAMEDPSLVPGTELLGATIISGNAAAAVGLPDPLNAMQDEIMKRLGSADQGAPLPPYGRIGIGYRRGATFAERYWQFSILYLDETAARETGDTLVRRIQTYQSLVTGQPLLGRTLQEVLPPHVTTSPHGTVVTVLARAVESDSAALQHYLARRDLQFLAWGPVSQP